MLIRLKNVLGEKELASIRQLLARANFVDGKLSAGASAAQVKNNQEVANTDPTLEQLNQMVMGNLVRHKTYQRAVLPIRIASPFYARYQSGMSYGEHIDDPVMGLERRYRSDVAITVFLSEPQDYQGGELFIQTELGEQKVKYAAGDAVLYPATTRHRVAEVTQGERVVAVTWAQSMVKDMEQRSLLYELGCAREKLLHKQPYEEHTRQVDLVYVNLVRKWSDI